MVSDDTSEKKQEQQDGSNTISLTLESSLGKINNKTPDKGAFQIKPINMNCEESPMERVKEPYWENNESKVELNNILID